MYNRDNRRRSTPSSSNRRSSEQEDVPELLGDRSELSREEITQQLFQLEAILQSITEGSTREGSLELDFNRQLVKFHWGRNSDYLALDPNNLLGYYRSRTRPKETELRLRRERDGRTSVTRVYGGNVAFAEILRQNNIIARLESSEHQNSDTRRQISEAKAIWASTVSALITGFSTFGFFWNCSYQYLRSIFVPPAGSSGNITTNSVWGAIVEVLSRSLAGFIFGATFWPIKNLLQQMREDYAGAFNYVLADRNNRQGRLGAVIDYFSSWAINQFTVNAGYTSSHLLIGAATGTTPNIGSLHTIVASTLSGAVSYWFRLLIGKALERAGRAERVLRHPKSQTVFLDELKSALNALIDDLHKPEYRAVMLLEAILAAVTLVPFFTLGEVIRAGRNTRVGVLAERGSSVAGWFFIWMLLRSILTPWVRQRHRGSRSHR